MSLPFLEGDKQYIENEESVRFSFIGRMAAKRDAIKGLAPLCAVVCSTSEPSVKTNGDNADTRRERRLIYSAL